MMTQKDINQIDINNTGERILLDKESPLMIARHFCAYKFAKDSVQDKEVLDIGCGEGYGADYLANYAKSVQGIDYDQGVIAYAKNKYKKNNLNFAVLDIKNLDSIGKQFDIVCSFQNIEHIKETDKLLNNICKLLTENGVFICSTCNMKDASPGRSTPFNRFHVKEYLIDEFKWMLRQHFSQVDIFGLNRGIKLKIFRRLKKSGLFKFLPHQLNFVDKFFDKASCEYFFWSKNRLGDSLDFIAFCRRK